MPDSIYFPSSHLDFSKAFFRLNAVDRRAKAKNNGANIVNKSIYLPLPNEIFSQNFTMSYSTEELGAFGEVAARNTASVANQLDKIIKNGFSDIDISKTVGTIVNEAASTLKTQFADSLVSGFGSIDSSYGKILQGFGYTYAPNKTQTFEGVTQYRTFVANWELYPKNYQDAKNIDQIFAELLRHALPKLEKNIVLEYIKEGFESKAVEFLEPNKVSELKKAESDGDTSQKATEDDLTIMDTVKKKAMDVLSPILESGEFYPTTFEVPNAMKISIMQRTGDDSAEEMEESFHFPYNFYIQQVISNVVGNSSDQNASFIEYRNESGEVEYFPIGRKLVLYLVEERPLTASDYTHRKKYENA